MQDMYSGLDKMLQELPNRFVALCGNASLQWYVVDLACDILGAPTVSS